MTLVRRLPWGYLIFIGLIVLVVLSRFYLAAVRPIHFFDESLYLATTHGLLKYRILPPWSLNPGVTVLNTIWYYPIRLLPLGLDLASRFGFLVSQLATFGLMALVVRTIMPDRRWVMVALGLGLLLPTFWNIDLNSTDAYYMAFAIGIFYLLYQALGKPSTHVAWLWVSITLTLATSVRSDATLVYGVSTLVYVVVMGRTAEPWRRKVGMAVLLWLLPLILMQVGFTAFASRAVYNAFSDYGIPNFDSTAQRVYLAFEQGEGYARRYELEAEGKTWWGDGQLVAVDLYGTEEANDSNIFRAIANNPAAWLNRLKWNLRDFFISSYEAFSTASVPILLISLWGFGMMLRHNPRAALVVSLLFAPTTIYFLFTFWQPRYLATLSPLWVVLGVYALYQQASSERSVTPLNDNVFTRWFAKIPFVVWHRGVALFVLAGAALMVSVFIRRAIAIPPTTLLLTVILFCLLCGLWLFPTRLSARGKRWAGSAFGVALVLGMAIPLPGPYEAMTPYQLQIREYVARTHRTYENQRVCHNKGDLRALSLIWYAHQRPVESPADLLSEMNANRLATTMRELDCAYVLISGDGQGNPVGPVTHPTVRVVFESMYSDIVFFEIAPDPPVSSLNLRY